MALSFILTIAMLGIPFYGHGTSSVVIGVIVIAALWLYLRPKTQAAVKEKFRVSARTLNTSLLCTMMIVIGYSSYALIVIRSTANTPMDQNSPEDIFTLGEYLGREQYGTRPLFYGPAFSSQVALDVKDGYCEPRIKSNRASSTTARSSSARRKLHPMKRIRTSKSPDALSTNTPRTCCFRVCTAVPTHNNTMPGRTSRVTMCPMTNAAT